MQNDPTRRWTRQDALETYGIPYWGQGYFGTNDRGHITVRPCKSSDQEIDLKGLVDRLASQGIRPPVLLRFTDMLRHRLGAIAASFEKAIKENQYQAGYICVYPVKVNQARQVVTEVRDFGQEYGFGLEVGSKPELLAVLALTADRDIPVVCNGFKDNEFIEMVILAQKLGKRVIPVVEKFSELEMIIDHAEVHGVRPVLGIRIKLAARGAGRWELSGGLRSKFGLFVPEVLKALDYLKERGLEDCLKLVHFHLGSQITQIRNVKNAVTELARVYVELRRAGAGVEYIDVGGGLGVDYDGSQTSSASSMNYTLEEYASDVVFRIMSVCDEAEIPHPTIISESGRALVAYHSLLVFEVMGSARFDEFETPGDPPIAEGEEEPPLPLLDLFERLRDLTARNCIEYFHDALHAYEEAMTAFNLGYLTLEQRGVAERYFWALCGRVLKVLGKRGRIPEDLEGLSSFMADIYYCNFSIFQSMPDSWAIDQIFPIAPIHRLNTRPTRRGILADVTCDSDGKITNFTSLREDKDTLELHELDGSPYYLAAFLIGAYQEILGDLHNLFGDTHVVHVNLGDDGVVDFEHLVRGDTVREVLSYVHYSAEQLFDEMRKEVDRALKRERLSLEEAARLLRFYESGLGAYTYLHKPN